VPQARINVDDIVLGTPVDVIDRKGTGITYVPALGFGALPFMFCYLTDSPTRVILILVNDMDHPTDLGRNEDHFVISVENVDDLRSVISDIYNNMELTNDQSELLDYMISEMRMRYKQDGNSPNFHGLYWLFGSDMGPGKRDRFDFTSQLAKRLGQHL
jgi:hypothetical protein